jgi:methylthioribose-1-phosphate isomerase
MYVAAPFSTIDMETRDGSGIPIEHRAADEVTHIGGKQIAPTGVLVENQAFDVTPARYISGIITERGVATAPFKESIMKLAEKKEVVA